MIAYEEIYSRNIGLFTTEEQKKLREAIVAVAGVGGVGSYQARKLRRRVLSARGPCCFPP